MGSTSYPILDKGYRGVFHRRAPTRPLPLWKPLFSCLIITLALVVLVNAADIASLT